MDPGGGATRVLEVDGPAGENPVLFLHGNPTNADDWRPFLERIEGRRRAFAPDFLGWGKADRPPGFRFTMEELADWLERLIEALTLERFDLVVHDWGVIGLVVAQRRPDAVGRLVVMDTVPLFPGYRWHWVARLWRRRGVGELLNATVTRFGTTQLMRQATPRPGSLPEVVDRFHEHLDAGNKRAILDLYRAADPDRLVAAGRDLGRLSGPALVAWGEQDPYIHADFADRWAERLGGEPQVLRLENAGHFPWLDRPELIDTVCDFIAGPVAPPAHLGETPRSS